MKWYLLTCNLCYSYMFSLKAPLLYPMWDIYIVIGRKAVHPKNRHTVESGKKKRDRDSKSLMDFLMVYTQHITTTRWLYKDTKTYGQVESRTDPSTLRLVDGPLHRSHSHTAGFHMVLLMASPTMTDGSSLNVFVCVWEKEGAQDSIQFTPLYYTT